MMTKNYFIERIKYVLFNSDSKLNVSSIKYLPRWMVVLLDTLIVCGSVFLSYLVIKATNMPFYEFLTLWQQAALIVGVQVLSFFIYGTYSGLIRHSTNVDVLKITIASFSTCTTLVILSYLSFLLVDEKIFLMPFLIVYGAFSFGFMLLFRIIVKGFYSLFKNLNPSNKKRILLLGVNDDTISIGESMNTSNAQGFELAGFISFKKAHTKIKILGKPVYKYNNAFFDKINVIDVDGVLIVGNYISIKQKNNIVDRCLQNGLSVYNAPELQQWNEGDVNQNIKEIQIEDLLERSPIVLNDEKINNFINNKVVLVTGGAGSIGSEIARQVSHYSPKEILIIDQAESPLHELEMELLRSHPDNKYQFILADVRKKSRIEQVFKEHKVEVVFHAAAYKHVPLIERNPTEAISTNIIGTIALADLAVQYNVNKFVMVSTDKAVNPTNVMGATKRAAEIYVQALQGSSSHTRFITTRFGNVLGSNGSVIPHFKKQIAQGGPVTVTHQDIIRYFMTIPEACQLVLQAGTMGSGGEVYVFDMGKPVKIMDLAKRMIRLSGLEPEKDIEIKITGLRPGEKLFEELLNDTSTTVPTHHEKIMIAKDRALDLDEVSDLVIDIAAAAEQQNQTVAVSKLKQLVPEFISRNSVFEVLDTKVKISK